MTQPQIKKYRKRVSDERILNGAKAIWVKCRYGLPEIFDRLPVTHGDKEVCMEQSQAVLEADAEVIEAQPYDKIKGYMLLDYGGSVCDIEEIEQFNAEWEEITE